jgi:hypothetical protein
MGIAAAAKASEEFIKKLVILAADVLDLPEPGPEIVADLIVAVRADPSEIVSLPALDVLTEAQVTALWQVEPLCYASFVMSTGRHSRWI